MLLLQVDSFQSGEKLAVLEKLPIHLPLQFPRILRFGKDDHGSLDARE
jgi:hypothetical protein